MFLVGRAVEAAWLSDALARGDDVLLWGPAGIGKSALASAVASTVQPHWRDAAGREELHDLPPDGLLVVDAADDLDADGWRRLQHDLGRRDGPSLVTARRQRPWPGPTRALGPVSPSAGAAILRGAVGVPGRAATLPQPQLEALSERLGGLPGALVLAAPALRKQDPGDLGGPPASPATSAPRPLAADLRAAAAVIDGPASTTDLSAACARPVETDVASGLANGSLVLARLGDGRVMLPPGSSDRPTARQRAEVLERLASVLPRWEAAAARLDSPLGADAFATVTAARPALTALTRSSEPDVALRAALVLAARERRVGPAQAILDRDATLPAGGAPELRARWAVAAAGAAERLGQASRGQELLARDPAPPGTVAELDQRSLSALLHARLGQFERAAERREELGSRDLGPQGPRIEYRLGLAAFYAGELAAASDHLQGALTETGGERDTLLHLQALLLNAVVGRARGWPSAGQLPAFASVRGLWAQTGHLEVGPAALVVHGVLLADEQRWTDAAARFQEAAALLSKLERHGEAAVQRYQGLALTFHTGQTPMAMLEPQSGEAGWNAGARAEIEAWRGVAQASVGGGAAAAERVLHASRGLTQSGQPSRAVEFLMLGWAALRGCGADASSLERALSPLTERPDLRAWLRAAPEPHPARWDHHLVRDLLRPPRRVQVAGDGAWFEVPGHDRVDLGRRRTLRRLLAALAEAPGFVGLQALVDAGWPGQQLVAGSGRRRVEVALSTLRGLGLRDHLQTRVGPDGAEWRLDSQDAQTASTES